MSKITENDVKELIKSPKVYIESITNVKLVTTLKFLSYEYYKNGNSVVSDEIFDYMKGELERRDPKNKFLKQVGSKAKGMSKLPYPMPSLDKIKPDTNVLPKWLEKYKGNYILSDKLDGISGLFVKNNDEYKLYTRGDTYEGQDISYLIKYLFDVKKFSKCNNFAIRGEIIMSKKNFKKISDTYKNARNTIAGLVNSKTVRENVATITEFIGYAVLNPVMKIEEQLKYIEKVGIKCVPYIKEVSINNDYLSNYLILRRKASKYDIDGIVVMDNSKIYTYTDVLPTYAFAFKMVLSDQTAETTVVDVVWNVSKDGYIYPIVEVEPIKLRDVCITYVTAHHANVIVDNKIGPGSVLEITRRGDVIPHIERIIKPSLSGKPKLPDIEYIISETGVDFIVRNMNNSDISIKKLEHTFGILGVKHAGIGIITKLVDNGYDDIFKILSADKKKLEEINGLGNTIIDKLYNSLDEVYSNVSMSKLMASSNIFGRGLSEKRLKLIVSAIPELNSNLMKVKITKQDILNIDGFSDIMADKFIDNFNAFKVYYKNISKLVKLNNITTIKNSNKTTINKNIENKKFVLTGFRSKSIEEFIESNKGIISSSVSKNTNCVIYTDTNSSKYKKGVELNLELITRDNFVKKYNISI